VDEENAKYRKLLLSMISLLCAIAPLAFCQVKKAVTDHLAFEVASVKANKSDGEAYKEQLGIKMVSRKGPSELFFIDQVEKPSEN
jgi:hypothetical protein